MTVAMLTGSALTTIFALVLQDLSTVNPGTVLNTQVSTSEPAFAEAVLMTCFAGQGFAWPSFSTEAVRVAQDIPSPVPFSNASSLLASLQQRGSPSVDLAGRFFQHTDESGLLPAALARSTASRKAENEEIPGMYGYAREINRLMLEDPPWSFTSLEQPSAACAVASQCRLVTTDAPSDALASRDLGGAVAVELFRVARQKERLWHRAVFDNQTFHQKLASELSAFDEVHTQLASLMDGSAQLLEALPRLWGETMQHAQVLQRSNCAWLVPETARLKSSAAGGAELLLMSALVACLAALCLAMLTWRAFRLWWWAQWHKDTQSSGVSTRFYLSPWVSDLSSYVDISWTLVIVLRIPSVIIPRNIFSVVLCNLCFFVMTCIRIFLDDWSTVDRESPLRNPILGRVLVLELLASLAVLAFAVLVKAFLRKSAEKSLEVGASSKLSQQLNAATSLLHLCCDAVVELDSRLRLRKHSSELAAMLLRDFQGASLAEMKLTDFMPAVDAAKAMTYLQDFRSTSNSSMSFKVSDNKQAHAFISRMVDSGATKLKVEIFQVMYQNPGGEICHLVGIRDITDSKPFVSDEEMSDVTIPFQEQVSESRSGELDMSLRSSQARVCLDLDVGEFMRVASATAPLTHVVGASIEKIFPQSICMLMKRICDEGRLFLDRNEPLPGKTFSFESLPAQWSADRNPEDISGFFQLARNVSGKSHVLMFFSRGNHPSPPGSPLCPLSPWSLSPPSVSRRSSNRSNRERGSERVVNLAPVGRGSPRTPQPMSIGEITPSLAGGREKSPRSSIPL